MLRRTIVFAVLLCCAPALADENLHPEPSGWFSGKWPYNPDIDQRIAFIKQTLPEAYDRSVIARMIALPTNRPVRAVALKKSGDRHTIVAFHMDGSRGHKIDRCEVPVDAILGAQIVSIWKGMLLQTRYYDKPRVGLDGTDYHFTYEPPIDSWDNSMAGQIWSPDEQTRSGMLVAIADAMDGVCMNSNAGKLLNLKQQLDALSERLRP